MGGLAILFSKFFYLLLTIFVLFKVKPLWGKAIALLLAILIPTADAVYGRYQLKQMCAEEGGIRIYRTVENVGGYISNGAASDYLVRKKVYQFSEAEGVNGQYYRVIMQDSELVRESNVTPLSKYRVRFFWSGISTQYWKATYSIETFPDGEVLATNIDISFMGGWAERFLGSFADAAGSVASCGREMNKREFILSVLKP